jgi:hypothetical protein
MHCLVTFFAAFSTMTHWLLPQAAPVACSAIHSVNLCSTCRQKNEQTMGKQIKLIRQGTGFHQGQAQCRGITVKPCSSPLAGQICGALPNCMPWGQRYHQDLITCYNQECVQHKKRGCPHQEGLPSSHDLFFLAVEVALSRCGVIAQDMPAKNTVETGTKLSYSNDK